MTTARKPRTNWHLVVWPIVVLWIVAAIYVFQSGWRESATVVLPIFMAVAAFVVFLLNGLAGSLAQRRYELEILDTATSECKACRREDGPLHLIDYHWYLFLGALVFEFGERGKYCPHCAKLKIDWMFRRTLWGSLFCPPLTVWAWIQRRRILKRIGQE